MRCAASFPFLFTAVAALAVSVAAQEVRRPTTETVSSTPAACAGAVGSSSSAPNFYDASGESTSSTVLGPITTQSAPNKYKQAVISGWQAASGTYSSLTLKVRSGCSSNTGNPSCQVQYSTNGGSSWVQIQGGNWGALTDSVTLSASQNLSQLRIRYCVESQFIDFPEFVPDRASLTGYDIRTEGNLGPFAPSNLGGSAAANGLSVTLTWTDNSSNESGFKIDRCTGAGCTNFALQGSVGANVTSFPDTTSACATYNYRAYAFNGQGNSDFSNSVQVSTPCAPTAPSGLSASAASTTSINLSWTDGSGETSYSLERCEGASCTNFSPVASPTANATSHTDTNLTANTIYTYRIRGSNAVGFSGYSNTGTALTPQSLSLSTPWSTFYTYDALGNLTKVEQHGSSSNSADWRIRTFTYDSLSQLRTATNPELGTATQSGTITYDYDNDGNLISRISPAPNQPPPSTATQTITYCYDVLHRPTQKFYSAASCGGGSPDVAYSYDQASFNGLTIDNSFGRRTGMTDASGQTAWSYDSQGRAVTERRTIAGVTKTTSYSYNLDGSIASITYPTGSGRTISYTYNSAGRAVTAKDIANNVNYVTDAAYTPFDSLASMKNGVTGSFGGITTTNSYNTRLQPITLSAASPTQTILSLTYGFNLGAANNGNVISIQNNRDTTRSQTFTYDDLNRLASAETTNSNLWANAYQFDAWDNLNKMLSYKGKPEAQHFDQMSNGKNQLIGYSYDVAGNLLDDGVGHSFTYDAENRIATAGGITYTYDGDDKRVKKSSGKLYWTGIGSKPLTETDAAGNNPTEYIFFNGKRIARRDPTGAVHYYFDDHLSSASVITNATGAMPPEQESDYYPFGGELSFVTGPNNYKFTGKERDGESGLDYFGARYYGSILGRFTSVDPKGITNRVLADPQQLNRYTYTRNNPGKYVDPDGLELRLAPGLDQRTQNRIIKDMVETYRRPSGRAGLQQLDKSPMKFTLGDARLPDRPIGGNPGRKFGQTDPSGVVGTQSPEGKVLTVDQSKSSVKIEFDFKKLDKGYPEAPSEKTLFNHEVAHGVDLATDPVRALNKTQGEAETFAEDFKDQVAKEKPDMSKKDAKKAVQQMLDDGEGDGDGVDSWCFRGSCYNVTQETK